MYYYVGGMPVAVLAHVEQRGLKEVRTIQNQVLQDYRRDFSKHAPAREVPRINLVWDSIPAQLAKENKKYVYGAVKKSARAKTESCLLSMRKRFRLCSCNRAG